MRTKHVERKNLSRNAQENLMEGVDIWTSFWRENPHRFCLDYLDINIKIFQQILIYAMDKNDNFCFLASRGLGKTFLTAVYCCCRCILYPGTKINISSKVKSQSNTIISEKIKDELMPNSVALRKEIKEIKTSANDCSVEFWNGSTIKVLTANDNARSKRSNILIVDEYRMVDENIINGVLVPTLTAPRQPGYLSNPKYSHLQEENKEIYLSSGWYSSTYSYVKFKEVVSQMLKGGKAFACSIPFTCSLEHGFITKAMIKKEMEKATMTHASFLMEYCGLFFGESDSSFFKSNDINPTRVLKRPFYPMTDLEYVDKKKKKSNLPKQPDEIRIIGADIAIAAGKQNDNSVFTLLRVLPNGGNFERQLVYMESHNGMNPENQSIRIKQLFEEFEADYIAFDRSGVGASVWNELQKVQECHSRGIEYPAFTAMNEDNTVDKVTSKGAKPVVYTIANPSPTFNNDVATGLLAAFQKKDKLKLLIDHLDARSDMLESKSDYAKLSPEEQARLELPFVETTALVNELINLEYTLLNQNVRISEKGNARKDRYSSLGYSNYLAHLLEEEENKKRNMNRDDVIVIWN
ncbi:MAG: terminase large subunit domain-containing protein [Cetobacterium sp.]